MRRTSWSLAVLTIQVCAGGAARATDIPITGLKLIVVDKTVTANKAKAVFVAKYTAITKGTGTDPAQIGATLDVAYDSVSGAFTMPQGANWLVNSASVAKYVNKAAPTGGAVKVSVIKPASLVKVVGKSLGDTPLDISSAPSGLVYVADTIVNGGCTTRLCTQFSGCDHKAIAGGTGYKLVCKDSKEDPVCLAVTPCGPIRFVDQGATVLDTCTNLQWEKKTTAVGSGENFADLHDVDNLYRWAGLCTVTTSKRCQPSAAAEAACKAQTDVSQWDDGCEQCTGGEGTCDLAAGFGTPRPTVWDWLAQLNAANYAGHNDWRLPSESAQNARFAGPSTYDCSAVVELETILFSSYPCGTFPDPCIDSIFGPTERHHYWSSSTVTPEPLAAWVVNFGGGFYSWDSKTLSNYVRAVRGSS